MAVIRSELVYSFIRSVPQVLLCNVHFVAAWVNLVWLLVVPSAVVSLCVSKCVLPTDGTNRMYLTAFDTGSH